MIVVFGSLNIDLVFAMDRLPGAGETALARTLQVVPGGKGGNQAVAAARDGADVHMVGCVGGDAFGAMVLASLKAAGIDCAQVSHANQPTGCASVCVDARCAILNFSWLSASLLAPGHFPCPATTARFWTIIRTLP